jgi:hypothetical protein
MVDFLSSDPVDIDALFAPGKPSMLELKGFEKASANGNVLPPDLRLSSKRFTRLFLKPLFSVSVSPECHHKDRANRKTGQTNP